MRALRVATPWVLAMLCLLASCSKPEHALTQAVVAVTAEPRLAASLRFLRVSIFPRDAVEGSSPATVNTIPVPRVEAQSALMLSFGIQKQQATELLVVVRGCADAACSHDVAEQKVYILFQPRRTVQVTVLLTSACSDAGQRCARLDQTCSPTDQTGSLAGACTAIPAAETTIIKPGAERYTELPLPPWVAGPPDASAMASAEASAEPNTDAALAGGIDAGEAAIDAQVSSADECPATHTCQPSYPCERDQGTGYICRGQFADWRMPDSSHDAGVAQSYDTSRDGLVLDLVTGLEWERDTQGIYPGCTGRLLREGDRCSWEEAREYCKNLVLYGTGWRLPSLIELESLLDLRPGSPIIDIAFSLPMTSSLYWSNSPNSAPMLSGMAYGIWFGEIPVNFRTTSSRELARCVRSPKERVRPVGSRYAHNLASGEISDLRTGLTWLPRAVCEGMDRYENAAALCTTLDARLPSAKELLTLTDPTIPTDKSTAATNPLFGTPPFAWFWSSSRSKDGKQSLLVGSAFGQVYTEQGLSDHRMTVTEVVQPSCVRCVKGTH
ncbi:MAG: hypothetical protein RLZZ450_4112 [Pseudomonadota bacterium]